MGSGTKIPGYLTFAYYGGMPKLNMSNDETAEYFTNVGKYWIEECDIDGWRLDVGDEISHSFMKNSEKQSAVSKKMPSLLEKTGSTAGIILTVMNGTA